MWIFRARTCLRYKFIAFLVLFIQFVFSSHAAIASVHRDVDIVSGHAARDKVVSVAGIDADEIERRLSVAVGKDDR